jgi:ATP-binding protein involved in chromosome partitioning
MLESNKEKSQIENAELEQRLNQMKKKLVVLSGKGGVGKSTVASNMALSMAMQGYEVGLLDIDFHGPSLPKILGFEGTQIQVSKDGLEPLKYNDKLKMMSLGLLLQSQDDAVIWRGPMKTGAIKQLLKDVNWGPLDYLVVDSPPGTGDEPLSVAQILKKVDGAIIVTTPQDLALTDVRKSIRFCGKLNMPVLGVIENMSGFVCPHCGKITDIFKSGGGQHMALDMGVPFLGRIPIEVDIVRSGDDGKPFVAAYANSETARRFKKIVDIILNNQTSLEKPESSDLELSDRDHMIRYAIPTANGELCLHFGHCETFAFIDVDEDQKKIVNQEFQNPPPHEPGVLPQWLAKNNVRIVIAGGMGSRAQSLFEQNGIQVITGAQVDKPEKVVNAYLSNNLKLGDNVCDH